METCGLLKRQVSAEFHGKTWFCLLPPPDAWILGFNQICLATSAHLSSLGEARQDSRLFTCNQLLPSHRDTQRVRALLHQGHRMLRRGQGGGWGLAGRLICDRSDQ